MTLITLQDMSSRGGVRTMSFSFHTSQELRPLWAYTSQMRAHTSRGRLCGFTGNVKAVYAPRSTNARCPAKARMNETTSADGPVAVLVTRPKSVYHSASFTASPRAKREKNACGPYPSNPTPLLVRNVRSLSCCELLCALFTKPTGPNFTPAPQSLSTHAPTPRHSSSSATRRCRCERTSKHTWAR